MARLIVTIGLRRLAGRIENRQGIAWSTTIERAGDQPMAELVDTLFSALPARRPAAVSIEVEPPLAQVRRLDSLPPVGLRDLETMVTQHAATFFRRNGHPLVTSATWLRPAQGTERQALMGAADASLIDALKTAAEHHHLAIERIAVAGLPEGDRLDLRSTGLKQQSIRREWRTLGRLATAAAILWGLAGLIWAGRLRWEERYLEKELRQLEPARSALLSGRAVRERAEAMVTLLDGPAGSRHRLEGRLESVLAALPDSSYLTGLTIDTTGSGMVTGGAHLPSAVVNALATTAAAIEPRLETEASADPIGGSGWTRFTIQFGAAPQ